MLEASLSIPNFIALSEESKLLPSTLSQISSEDLVTILREYVISEDVGISIKYELRQRGCPYQNEETIRPASSNIRPWVRYFARMFDFLITITIVKALAILIVSYTNFDWPLYPLEYLVLTAIVMVLIETLEFSLFGSTFGKSSLNIRLTNADGSKPSSIAIMNRTLLVFTKGLGFGMFGPLTMLYYFHKLINTGYTSWDYEGGFIVSHDKIGFKKIVVFIMATIVVLLVYSVTELIATHQLNI